MTIKPIIFVILFSGFLFIGCDAPVRNASNYFDCPRYFDRLADSLANTTAVLEKTMATNGATETLKINKPDWRAELLPFHELNISKPAQQGTYRVDTLITNGGFRIEHSAMVEDASVRTLAIEYDSSGTVLSVFAVTASKNPYHASADTLYYQSKGEYQISALSDPALGKSISFDLTGKIVPQTAHQ
jgi:hypothetical protein